MRAGFRGTSESRNFSLENAKQIDDLDRTRDLRRTTRGTEVGPCWQCYPRVQERHQLWTSDAPGAATM